MVYACFVFVFVFLSSTRSSYKALKAAPARGQLYKWSPWLSLQLLGEGHWALRAARKPFLCTQGGKPSRAGCTPDTSGTPDPPFTGLWGSAGCGGGAGGHPPGRPDLRLLLPPALRPVPGPGGAGRRWRQPSAGSGRRPARGGACRFERPGGGARTTYPGSSSPLRPGVTPAAHGPGRGQPAGGAEEVAAAGGAQQGRSRAGPWPPRSDSTSCGCGTTRR